MDRTKALSELIEQQRRNGFAANGNKVRFSLKDADRMMMHGLVRFLGEDAAWLPEYDEVARWLEDNEGYGLMCIGDCGRGKTILTRDVLPVLFRNCLRLAYNYCTARELCEHFEEYRQYRILCIDDVGTESKVRKFGNTYDYFEEIVDMAEQQHKLLILSTNLDIDQLSARYDRRTIDRLKGITRRVFFEGDSMRG